jgi:hypothetical protein
MEVKTLCELVYLRRHLWAIHTTEHGFLKEDSKIRFFKSKGEAASHEFTQVLVVDFDKCLCLLSDRGIRLNTDRANLIQNCFDVLDDLCQSVGFDDVTLFARSNRALISKVFWSCNLPAVTPEGHCFRAFLTTRETKMLHNTILEGLARVW